MSRSGWGEVASTDPRLLPGEVIAHHDGDDAEQAAQTGDHGLLVRFATGFELGVVGMGGGMARAGGERALEQDVADRAAPAADVATARPGAAFAGMWGHPKDGRGLLA